MEYATGNAMKPLTHRRQPHGKKAGLDPGPDCRKLATNVRWFPLFTFWNLVVHEFWISSATW